MHKHMSLMYKVKQNTSIEYVFEPRQIEVKLHGQKYVQSAYQQVDILARPKQADTTTQAKYIC